MPGCGAQGARARVGSRRGVARPRRGAVAHPRCAAGSSAGSDGDGAWTPTPERAALLAGWATFAGWAALGAPGGTAEYDKELVETIIGAPFSGAVNPLFEALFNSLGVIPGVMLAVLMPGAKDQPRLPAAPLIGASFALGFGALGPYLFTRERRPDATLADAGWVTRNVLESRLNGAALFAFASYLAYYAATNYSPEAAADFAQLFASKSALVSASTVDAVVLSTVAMPLVIAEDAQRRGWDNRAAAFAALPVVGPALYVLVRPPLPEE